MDLSIRHCVHEAFWYQSCSREDGLSRHEQHWPQAGALWLGRKRSWNAQVCSTISLPDANGSIYTLIRPHVMYIVPVGQNPTGATMLAQRKKEIYDICVEYGISLGSITKWLLSDLPIFSLDVIIVEDDPYYFLQEGPYVHPAQRPSNADGKVPTDEKYIMSLTPSFLAYAIFYNSKLSIHSLDIYRFDYQGRVVRLDTFSKVELFS